MTRDVLMVETVDQAAVMFKPFRVALLRELAEPRCCQDLARAFGMTPQKVYYHVKTLENAGLVTRENERVVNGIAEGYYKARARKFWLAPSLVRALGGARTVRDQTSLGVLAGHAEEMLEDVGHLAEQSAEGEHVPSLSLGVEVELPDADARAAFLTDLKASFEELAQKHAGTSDRPSENTFKFTLACYPNRSKEAA